MKIIGVSIMTTFDIDSIPPLPLIENFNLITKDKELIKLTPEMTQSFKESFIQSLERNLPTIDKNIIVTPL